ncbi:MAG: hypothetical protein KDC95_15740 [Planctomycetes bacterium]|nr:hypothetical protein [Planctomycetota bacterium]
MVSRGLRSARGSAFAVLLMTTLSSCAFLPVEFNLSPLYRQRIAPDGRVAEVDALWPLIHWERHADEASDVRLRPLWRRVAAADGSKIRHEFVAPFGEARFDPTESVVRLLPLFYYREHLHDGVPGQWDRDWFFTPLIWGGSSVLGENYFAVFPIFGSIPQFLTYERFTWFLFPLFLRTKKGDTTGTHLFWPFTGWGGSDDPQRPYWWRILPFFGKSIVPGKSESYSLLWPFFHWGKDRLDTEYPRSSFQFFPVVGWKTGGAFVAWSFLWPFFRHAENSDLSEKGGPLEGGRYRYWDFPWPLLRWLDDDYSDKPLHQRWVTPFWQHTWTDRQDSTVLLYPLIWLRHYWNKMSDRRDTYVLPFFWRNTIRYKKKDKRGTFDMLEDDADFEEGIDDHWRLWPFADYRTTRNGDWRFRTLSPWPWDGTYATGIREAWDFAWTLWHDEGDARGNRRTRAFAHAWSSRNFAGQRYQSSVPFLFNYVADEDGGRTLRLLQFLPIHWSSDR